MQFLNAYTILAAVVACQLFCDSHAARCVYYGTPGTTGEQTANGDHFDAMGMTASALPHVPLGTKLAVTNQRNGRSIEVTVNDRLSTPQDGDTLDLSYGAFGLIADHDDGMIPCTYDVTAL